MTKFARILPSGGSSNNQSLQHFISNSPWNEEGAIARIQSGGYWSNIVDNGKYGKGYEIISDIENAVATTISTYSEREVNLMLMRAREFDESVFQDKMAKIIENLL